MEDTSKSPAAGSQSRPQKKQVCRFFKSKGGRTQNPETETNGDSDHVSRAIPAIQVLHRIG